MKRQQIKEEMQKGICIVEYLGVPCEVLHLFRHKTWINYKGKIYKTIHKKLNHIETIECESTLSYTANAIKLSNSDWYHLNCNLELTVARYEAMKETNKNKIT